MTASRKVRRSPTGPLRKQATPSHAPRILRCPSGDKGLRETGCHDHYKRDSGEGKAESDLGIFRLAYEHTGAVEKKTKKVPIPALKPTV